LAFVARAFRSIGSGTVWTSDLKTSKLQFPGHPAQRAISATSSVIAIGRIYTTSVPVSQFYSVGKSHLAKRGVAV
jgi:hypothetical protein